MSHRRALSHIDFSDFSPQPTRNTTFERFTVRPTCLETATLSEKLSLSTPILRPLRVWIDRLLHCEAMRPWWPTNQRTETKRHPRAWGQEASWVVPQSYIRHMAIDWFCAHKMDRQYDGCTKIWTKCDSELRRCVDFSYILTPFPFIEIPVLARTRNPAYFSIKTQLLSTALEERHITGCLGAPTCQAGHGHGSLQWSRIQGKTWEKHEIQAWGIGNHVELQQGLTKPCFPENVFQRCSNLFTQPFRLNRAITLPNSLHQRLDMGPNSSVKRSKQVWHKASR